MFNTLFSLPTLLLMLGQALSGSDQRVVVTGVYVMQPSAPVQITSFTETSEDLLAAVTVTNKSEKRVTGFRLGWAVGVPQSCSTSLTAAKVIRQLALPDRVPLNPNESATTKAYGLLPENLITSARQRNTVLIDFQVAVVEVTFSDGSTWSAAFPGQGMFDGAGFGFQANKCNDGKLIPQALESACNAVSPSSGTQLTAGCANNDMSCTISVCSDRSLPHW